MKVGISTLTNKKMASSTPSYASILQAQLALALVKSTTEERRLLAKKLERREQVEPKLVATTMLLRQYAKLHPRKALEGKQLPKGLECRSASILINEKAIRVSLDNDKITKELEQL